MGLLSLTYVPLSLPDGESITLRDSFDGRPWFAMNNTMYNAPGKGSEVVSSFQMYRLLTKKFGLLQSPKIAKFSEQYHTTAVYVGRII